MRREEYASEEIADEVEARRKARLGYLAPRECRVCGETRIVRVRPHSKHVTISYWPHDETGYWQDPCRACEYALSAEKHAIAAVTNTKSSARLRAQQREGLRRHLARKGRSK